MCLHTTVISGSINKKMNWEPLPFGMSVLGSPSVISVFSGIRTVLLERSRIPHTQSPSEQIGTFSGWMIFPLFLSVSGIFPPSCSDPSGFCWTGRYRPLVSAFPGIVHSLPMTCVRWMLPGMLCIPVVAPPLSSGLLILSWIVSIFWTLLPVGCCGSRLLHLGRFCTRLCPLPLLVVGVGFYAMLMGRCGRSAICNRSFVWFSVVKLVMLYGCWDQVANIMCFQKIKGLMCPFHQI